MDSDKPNTSSTFEKNLKRARNWVASKPNEPAYVIKAFPRLLAHFRELKDTHPGITETQMQSILFDEIDSYASVAFENSFVFPQYMEYFSCKYLQSHPNKYKEISEDLKHSDVNFEKLFYQNCSSFDEYLSLYIYRLKKNLFNIIFTGYLNGSPENYKNFDDLLKNNFEQISKSFFASHFYLPEVSDVLTSDLDHGKKIAKIKQLSNRLKLPTDRKKLLLAVNLFMQGSFSYLAKDQMISEQLLREELASSTEKLVNQLDFLGHLDDYMTLFVSQMCRLNFPEFARPICKGGLPDSKFAKSLSYLSQSQGAKNIAQILDKDKLKKYLSFNYLNSSNDLSIESLLILNVFWSNRYVKELDLYKELMFTAHSLDIIPKILNDENFELSLEDITNILIKMDTFQYIANGFLYKKQKQVNDSEDLEEKDNASNSKIINYSYKPFIKKMKCKFGNKYHEYFSQVLPNCHNNLIDDANWFIRLHNPIFASYYMKNQSINSLIISIDNPDISGFPNVGIIPDSISPDGTHAKFSKSTIGFGFDAGLILPPRQHAKFDITADFLKTMHGDTYMRIFEGADDFTYPPSLEMEMPYRTLTSHLIFPLTKEYKSILKKAAKDPNCRADPRLIAHLNFTDSKHVPEHLKTKIIDEHGKVKFVFLPRYVDLATGELYTKVNDTYVKIPPQEPLRKENPDYEL